MDHVVDPILPICGSEGEVRPALAHAGASLGARRAIPLRPPATRRRSIRLKLFALLLAQSLFVVVAFSILIAWAFNRGFSQYMTAYDDQRAQDFSRALEVEYARAGGWNELTHNPQRWAELAMNAAGHKVADASKLQQVFQQFQSSDFPDSIPAPLPLRFVLLDANKRLIMGSMPAGATIRKEPIRYRGKVVGELGFVTSRQTPYDIEFRRRLETALGTIFVISVLVAMLPAMFIARFLTGSISAIGRAARTLAAGSRGARLAVKSNDELGDLARDFNDLSSALEGHEKLQRQWLADISHELRTPVQILMAETEAVVDGIRPPSLEGFKSLYDESHRLSRLIDDLHQLSLLDGGIARLQRVEVHMHQLLRDCVATESTRFSQRGIAVRNSASALDELCVIGDPDRLRQVFINLLENSLRYTDSGGEVQIASRADGEWARISFEDSSPGVQEHEIAHLFERLYRGESSRNRASGGAGLGLAIVRSILAAHGGSITAASSPLGGLRFDIQLPRAG